MSLPLTGSLSKQNCLTLSLTKEMQRLKVQLNDKNFELRKITEDCAEQKGKLLIDFGRERVQLQKTIKQLRERIAQQTEAWTCKIDQCRTEQANMIQCLKKDFEDRLQNERILIENKLHKEYLVKMEALQNQNKRVSCELNETTLNNSTTHQKILKDLQDKHQHSLKEQAESHRVALMLQYRQAQTKLKLAEQMLAQQAKMHLKAKEDMLALNGELVQQKMALVKEVRVLNCEVSVLNDKICCLENKAIELAQSFSSQIEKQKLQSRKALEIAQKENQMLLKQYTAKQKELRERFNTELSNINANVCRLKELHTLKQQCWQSHGTKILDLYEKRQSKKEDVKTIKHLQVQLLRKQFQLQKERKDLKSAKLQLENMEEVYDKIFVSSAYLNRMRSKSFKIKKMKCSVYNKSITDDKHAFFEETK